MIVLLVSWQLDLGSSWGLRGAWACHADQVLSRLDHPVLLDTPSTMRHALLGVCQSDSLVARACRLASWLFQGSCSDPHWERWAFRWCGNSWHLEKGDTFLIHVNLVVKTEISSTSRCSSLTAPERFSSFIWISYLFFGVFGFCRPKEILPSVSDHKREILQFVQGFGRCLL